MDFYSLSVQKHLQYNWKLTTKSKVPLNTKEDLSTYYSPWVAQPCREIAQNPSMAYKLTWKNNTIAVVSDWTAVLWLWNIWWLAWLPVMEWKAILFKEFGWVDAIPIVLKTQDPDEIIKIVENISPTFGWINLEDIKAPQCFYIEEQLQSKLDIPIFHDDQHWTAIVVLAWLINALKITNRDIGNIKIIVQWAWAAWIAIVKLLKEYWAQNVIVFDSKWAIYSNRNDLNKYKKEISDLNKDNFKGSMYEALIDADVFIWVWWQWWSLNVEVIQTMKSDPIIFAISNPTSEITPQEAKKWWAKIIATWRSDYPNQINNVLVFPWIFRWILDWWIKKIENKHKIAAAQAIANYVSNPNENMIIPNPLDKNISKIVANAVMSVW